MAINFETIAICVLFIFVTAFWAAICLSPIDGKNSRPNLFLSVIFVVMTIINAVCFGAALM